MLTDQLGIGICQLGVRCSLLVKLQQPFPGRQPVRVEAAASFVGLLTSIKLVQTEVRFAKEPEIIPAGA